MTMPAQPVQPPGGMTQRQAILRRLSGHGQSLGGTSDPKVAAYQFSRGLPATGQVDAATLSAGWTNGGDVDPMATNPYVQAYGQYDMNDYNNGYGAPQGSTKNQRLALRQLGAPTGNQQIQIQQ